MSQKNKAMAKKNSNVWTYRGRRLKQLEWGLWKDLDRKDWYFLCYRPLGRKGPVVRRWAWAGGPSLKITDLREHVRQVRSQIETRKAGLPVRVDAAVGAGEYLQELRRRNRSEKHLAGVERSLQSFLEFTGEARPDRLSVADVETFLRALQKDGLSPRTLNKYRAHLSGWFSWAENRGYVEANPAERVARATETRTLKAFPSPEQMTELVDASSPYDGGLWTLLAMTGLRCGSFLSLSADCFGPEGVRVPHTKRREEWILSYDAGCPLWRPDLSELGRRLWSERPPTGSYLRFHLEAACDRIGRRWTPHAFRHAFCSWLVSIGEHMSDVAAWAHHSSAQTTEKWYAHLRPGGREKSALNRKAVFTMRSHCLRLALAELPQVVDEQ